MRMKPSKLFPSFVAAGLLAAATLSAPDARADKTIALQMFDAGRKLMEAKDYDNACPKFEAAVKEDPSLNGALINLAMCNEARGHTASAWGEFKDALFAAKKSNDPGQEQFCKQRVDALEPKLSHLIVNAEQVPGLVIHRDEQEIPLAALGTEIPIDPGKHTIEATAPGFSVWSTSVQIGAAQDKQTVVIPKLTPAPTKPGAGPGGDVAPPTNDKTRRTVGFVVGGVGVVGIGVGAVMGILAAGAKGDLDKLCPVNASGNKVCTPEGQSKRDSANTNALVSTIGFGVGIAGVAVGAILIATSGSSKTEAPKAARVRVLPTFGANGGGVDVLGRF